jgi:hypothetical protein
MARSSGENMLDAVDKPLDARTYSIFGFRSLIVLEWTLPFRQSEPMPTESARLEYPETWSSS